MAGNSTNNITQATEFYTEFSVKVFQTLYIIVLILGIIGNLLTTGVIIFRRKIRRSIYLYTLNLVICDILILGFYVPTQMSQIQNQLSWKMGEALCKIVNVVISVSITCTIGTLLSITIDRARGLIKPFQWRTDSWKKAKIIVPLIWLISILVNSPLLIYPKLETKGSFVFCAEGWPERIHADIFWTIMFIVNFAIPLIIIPTSYLVIIRITRKNKKHDVRRCKTNLKNTYGKRLVRMVVSLVTTFFICSGCQHIVYFIFTYSDIDISEKAIGLLFGTSNFLVSLQSALNPFLYCNIHHDLWKLCFKKKLGQPLAEIARLSSYFVVNTSIFEEPGIPLCLHDRDSSDEAIGECSEVNVTLRFPHLGKGKRRLRHISRGIKIKRNRLQNERKHSSVGDDIGNPGVHYLMEMKIRKTRSMTYEESIY